MPLIRCLHCGEDAFSIAGWAASDHCPSCGRPLGERRVKLNAALKAKRRLRRPQGSGSGQPHGTGLT